MENDLLKTWPIQIDVVEIQKKKFFALQLNPSIKKKRKEKIYDDTVYFEYLNANRVSFLTEVSVYQEEKLIDSCEVDLESSVEPGGGLKFMFKYLKRRNDQTHILAKDWEVGTRIKFEWDLEDEVRLIIRNDFKVETPDHKGLTPIIHNFFIQRAVFGKQNNKVVRMAEFTLFTRSV